MFKKREAGLLPSPSSQTPNSGDETGANTRRVELSIKLNNDCRPLSKSLSSVRAKGQKEKKEKETKSHLSVCPPPRISQHSHRGPDTT